MDVGSRILKALGYLPNTIYRWYLKEGDVLAIAYGLIIEHLPQRLCFCRVDDYKFIYYVPNKCFLVIEMFTNMDYNATWSLIAIFRRFQYLLIFRKAIQRLSCGGNDPQIPAYQS